MDEIAKRIHDRRLELGLTLEDVGKAVGVGKSTVRKWENGMIKNMGRDKIAALAAVLQIKPVELVPGNGEETLTFRTPVSDEKAKLIDQLEALHQNPRLRLLFDRSRKMSDEDVEFMLQMAERILKEHDGE